MTPDGCEAVSVVAGSHHLSHVCGGGLGDMDEKGCDALVFCTAKTSLDGFIIHIWNIWLFFCAGLDRSTIAVLNEVYIEPLTVLGLL